MRFSGFRCDGCQRLETVDGDPGLFGSPLPATWYTLEKGSRYHDKQDEEEREEEGGETSSPHSSIRATWHFCSPTCLGRWATHPERASMNEKGTH